MQKMGKIRDRILDFAIPHFFRLGFTKVTMDELSSGLGMSKKTVYKHFPGKEQLLQAVAGALMKQIGRQVNVIVQDQKMDYMMKLKELMRFVGLQLSRMSRTFILDVQKNAPDLWQQFEEFRRETILSQISGMIREGIKKGAFRKDLNQELLIIIYMNTIQSTINPEILVQLPVSAPEAFDSIISIFLEGILTEAGREHYYCDDSRISKTGREQ